MIVNDENPHRGFSQGRGFGRAGGEAFEEGKLLVEKNISTTSFFFSKNIERDNKKKLKKNIIRFFFFGEKKKKGRKGGIKSIQRLSPTPSLTSDYNFLIIINTKCGVVKLL